MVGLKVRDILGKRVQYFLSRVPVTVRSPKVGDSEPKSMFFGHTLCQAEILCVSGNHPVSPKKGDRDKKS